MRSDSVARYTYTAHIRYQSPAGCQERKIPVFHAWIDPPGQQVYLKMGIFVLKLLSTEQHTATRVKVPAKRKTQVWAVYTSTMFTGGQLENEK
jgi:hypothetical protein